MLFAYGKECLANDEFKECWDRRLDQYYNFLGRRLLVDRDSGFWSYHKKTFANLGIGFSHARLAKAAVGQLFGFVLNPRSTVASIRRLFSLRKIRSRQMRKVVLQGRSRSTSGRDNTEEAKLLHSMPGL
jgi:hypothetical protein